VDNCLIVGAREGMKEGGTFSERGCY
jgi:hypothetical protein